MERMGLRSVRERQRPSLASGSPEVRLVRPLLLFRHPGVYAQPPAIRFQGHQITGSDVAQVDLKP